MSRKASLKKTAVSRIAYFSLFFVMMVAPVLHFGAATAHAATASLSWTAPTTYTDGSPLTTLGGYKIYSGTTAGQLSQSIDVGKVNSYSFSSLNDLTTYYFAVAAYDTSGDASALSSQASLTTPPPPPSNNLYSISASAGSGGSITPSGAVVVSQASSQTFAIAAGSGFKIAGVTVDGTSVGAVSNYTFSNVAANHSIAATFSPSAIAYTITASSGAGGTISPAGATAVSATTNQSYTVTPSAGYYVVGVVVDGATVVSNIPSGGYTYTFSNVNTTHTISATFALRAFLITASAGTGGTISPAAVTRLMYNTSQTMTVTASSGYHVAGVVVDGVSVGAVSSYLFNNVSADHTINASFAVNTVGYTITSSAGTGGTITSSITASQGTNQSFTVTPNAGYYVVGVVVDGATVASNISSGGYTYTFTNLGANHTISASFAIRYFWITPSAGTGGSISPGTQTRVMYNTSETVTIQPRSGKKIAAVLVDGTSVGAVSSYTFSNVNADHTISASFQ